MRDAKPLASPPDAAAKARAKTAGKLLGDVETRRLVFVDGAFVAELSDLAGLEPGLEVVSLADALAGDDAALAAHLGKLAPPNDVAVALNTALMGDGAVIRIGAGSTIERPLHLLFVASQKPAASFVRSLVVVERGARAMLIESHEGPAGSDYQVNAALELFVGDEAHVDHVKIIGEGDGRAACLDACGGDRGQGALQRLYLYDRRRCGAQPAFPANSTARTPLPISAAPP